MVIQHLGDAGIDCGHHIYSRLFLSVDQAGLIVKGGGVDVFACFIDDFAMYKREGGIWVLFQQGDATFDEIGFDGIVAAQEKEIFASGIAAAIDKVVLGAKISLLRTSAIRPS